MLNEQRIVDMTEGIKQLIELRDPIGECVSAWERPNGLSIQEMRVPLGVVGMIYEARPNVTVDLCYNLFKNRKRSNTTW